MRAKLLGWLVDVQIDFDFSQESLYIAINIVDAFLYSERVDRQHLQLLGAAAMLVATKYEEMHPPSAAQVRAWRREFGSGCSTTPTTRRVAFKLSSIASFPR